MVVVIACVTCFYFLIKKRYIEVIVLMPITLFTLNATMFSYRFFLGLYPIYLMLALLGEKRKWLFGAFLAFEIAIMPLAVHLWVTEFGPV